MTPDQHHAEADRLLHGLAGRDVQWPELLSVGIVALGHAFLAGAAVPEAALPATELTAEPLADELYGKLQELYSNVDPAWMNDPALRFVISPDDWRTLVRAHGADPDHKVPDPDDTVMGIKIKVAANVSEPRLEPVPWRPGQ